MSILAICPVADIAYANNALDAAGYGSGNFSVGLFGNTDRPSYATLHCWTKPDFLAALEQLPGVTIHTEFDNDPQSAMQTMLNAQGLVWPSNAPMLPDTGTVMSGEYYRSENGEDFRFWRVVQQHDRGTFGGDPAQYPALIREARIPGTVRPWQQPIDQFDAYLTVDPFTGLPERAIYDGKVIEATSGSAGGPGGALLNVSNPGDTNSGWTVVETGDPLPEPDGPEPWQPYDGTSATLWDTGQQVTHNGKTWTSNIDNNSFEPGVPGHEALWSVVP